MIVGLRGGRCEPYKLYWRRTSPEQEFKWYDVNSEYPYVQATHYYPKGNVTLDLAYRTFVPFSKVCTDFFQQTKGLSLIDILQDDTGKSGCGLIECELSTATDIYIPILPAKVKINKFFKNTFQVRTGEWIGYLTVLAMAVAHRQVVISKVKRLQFWANTSNTLFSRFIKRLYGAKVEASGWNSIFNQTFASEEDKKIFVRKSKEMGIEVNPEKVIESPGLRTTAKIMNNCGWGYLCQKPTANENHFFDNLSSDETEEMGSMLENLETDMDSRRMVGAPAGVGHYTRIRTTKRPEDITVQEMNKKIAYHVGGQVPAYGHQLVTTGLLSLHPSQPAYTDTDSIGLVVDRSRLDHSLLPTGIYLGNWVDEYPDKTITEFCSLGCKTYFLKMEDKNGKVSYKGRFKGIPMSSASYSLLDPQGDLAKLGMEEMKTILFTALVREFKKEELSADLADELTYELHYTNFFKRNPDFKITTRQEKKTVRFTFDKRKIIIPDCLKKENPDFSQVTEVNTMPLTDEASHLTSEEIEKWWQDEKTKELKYISLFK